MRRVVGYARIAPRERRSERPPLADQRRLIERACHERGWLLVGFEEDRRSGRTLRRSGLQSALDACRTGDADAIVVARLDRLTYVLADLAELARVALENEFAFVALDLDLDLAARSGRLTGEVLAAAARWQPRSLTRRSRRALGARRPGRPSSTPAPLARRIRALRASGATLQAICDTLNAEGVPTPRGGTHWRPTSLRAILRPTEGESS